MSDVNDYDFNDDDSPVAPIFEARRKQSFGWIFREE
jgi:hypothetical protein